MSDTARQKDVSERSHLLGGMESHGPCQLLGRGIPGFEPGTSRTLSENHAARPNPRDMTVAHPQWFIHHKTSLPKQIWPPLLITLLVAYGVSECGQLSQWAFIPDEPYPGGYWILWDEWDVLNAQT